MNQVYDELQRRLARLESGEPLESVLSGLPEAEANLIKLAVTLRQLTALSPAAGRLAAQRKQFLHTAQERKIMTTQPKTARPWVWALGLIGALSVCALALAGFAGLAGFGLLRNSHQSAFHAPNATSGVLGAAQGLVEIKSPDGEWTLAHNGQTVVVGQHLRTSALSGVTLAFYDGSQIQLGPQTEISVDTLDARTIFGPRIILLNQLSGQTQSKVAHSNNTASRYEVNTPSGVGAAKGTLFTVLVTSTKLVRFDVDEGVVAVTNLNVTVLVVAQQSTTIIFGQPPQQPLFRITGEGEVQATGGTWTIAGRTFTTNENTIIVGNPQVGDWVTVEGRFLASGARVADEIVLVRRADENTFSLSGAVESMGAAEWVISGKTIKVNSQTAIEEEIEVGDNVEVTGTIASDGTFLATHISPADEDETKLGFEFAGIVENQGDTAWTISGINVTVGVSTTIAPDLAVGDVVIVSGEIQEDGTWFATSIQPGPEGGFKFAFTGEVESLSPWKVNGVSFETNDATEIDDDIHVGDKVAVKGFIDEDGTWMAEEIARLDDTPVTGFHFIGLISSMDPWIIGGIPITTDNHTRIKGKLEVGGMAKVKGKILADGTWLATEIKHTGWHLGQLGCLGISTVVSEVSTTQLVLLNGQKLDLDKEVEVEGNIQPASVVIYNFCIDEDGNATVIKIIVVYQLETVPVIVNPNPNCEDGPDHDKGRGNDCHHKEDKDD